MTREKIREGIRQIILDSVNSENNTWDTTDAILVYLHSQGVVIRSDYTVTYSVPIQAGTELVLVEPLIKEEV